MIEFLIWPHRFLWGMRRGVGHKPAINPDDLLTGLNACHRVPEFRRADYN